MHEPALPPGLYSNAQRLKADYDRLWADAREQLARGIVQPDPVPDDTSRRWGISAVLRPSPAVGEALAAAAAQLRALAGERQVIYDGSSLHTTLRSIEFRRTRVAEDDERVREYAAVLRDIACHHTPIRILYRGLTANKTGVLAQGWPLDDELQALRTEFHAALDRAGLRAGPEAEETRQTAHASLVVFSGPLIHPRLLVDYVESHRETGYGVSASPVIDLVYYKRTDVAVELVTLASIPLGSSRHADG